MARLDLQLAEDVVCALMECTVWWGKLDKKKSRKGPRDAERASHLPSPHPAPSDDQSPRGEQRSRGKTSWAMVSYLPMGKAYSYSNITAVLSPFYTSGN